jgi:glycosyltransferase involved in cell wall biosynthesis
MTDPKVSIIIPTYNAAAFLPRAVESVLTQTYPRVQVVVVDDGSTDETPHLLKRFGSPVLCLRQTNRGPAAARNLGLSVAEGEYIGFLDADDWLLPRTLLRHVRFLEARPEHGWVYGDVQYVDEAGTSLDLASQRFRYGQRDSLEGVLFPALIHGNFIPFHAPLFRRRCLEETGPFDEDPELIGIEDWDLLLRLSLVAPAAYLPEICAVCTVRAGSLSSDPYLRERRRYVLLDRFQGGHRQQILDLGVPGRRLLADTHNWFGYAAYGREDWSETTRRLAASVRAWPWQRRAPWLLILSLLRGGLTR